MLSCSAFVFLHQRSSQFYAPVLAFELLTLRPSIEHYAFHTSVTVLVLHDSKVSIAFQCLQCAMHSGQNWVLKLCLSHHLKF